jgi:MtN3 and saliva related transmembrane protein
VRGEARGRTVQGVTELIGWASSAVLLATLARQVRKQWRDRTSAGVSRWLFVGQTTASLGFTVYSILVENWVFVVTNALLLVNAIAGLAIDRRQRHRAPAGAGASPAAGTPRTA